LLFKVLALPYNLTVIKLLLIAHSALFNIQLIV